MFNKLLSIFSRNKCDSDALIDKLICLKENSLKGKIDFKPYDVKFKYLELKVLKKDIVEFNNRLEEILKIDLENEYLDKEVIIDHELKIMTISDWFTDNKNLLQDINFEWYRFLDKSIELILWWDNVNKVDKTIFKEVNSRYLRPYIIYIESFVDSILNQFKKEMKDDLVTKL